MKTTEVKYKDGDTELVAYVAYDPNWVSPKPAVLIAHAWSGRDEFVCERAHTMVDLGYVGFALDMYGNAKQGSDNETNSKLMSPFMEDRSLIKRRMQLALNTMKELGYVDADKTAAIGYCFGGLCALDLARSGADLNGVVSFHGLLQGHSLGQNKIKAKVLALHGYDDPMVTPHTMLEFANEMKTAGADWQIHMYGGTMHAFTNPKANDPGFGTVYSEKAANRSVSAMINFFREIF